ncbi:glycosyltransferase family 52 [Vreelandella sp. H-I2]
MSPKHLAMITSPLQLINLRQLCADRQLDKAAFTVVVKFSKKCSSAQALQQEFELDRSDWGEVIILENKSKFLHLRNLVKRLHPINWKIVVSGELTSWWENIVVANVHYEERILIDDGTMTLFDYQSFMENGKNYQKRKPLKSLFLNILNVKTKIKKPWPITAFSLFPMDSNSYVRCEKNSLSILKRTLENQVVTSGCNIKKRLFIGQPFVDNKEISENEYIDIVSRYAAQNSKEECYYLPHRSESKEFCSKIKDINNITVASYSLPVEKVIGQYPESYSQVVGLNSTALFTIHILYPEIPIYFYSFNDLKTVSNSLLKRSLVVDSFLRKQKNTYPLSLK